MMEKNRLRNQECEAIILKIKKISMIDKEILNLYKSIEPIFDSYCNCKIDFYECDKTTYHMIFRIFKTIRFSESEFKLLQKILIQKN